MEIVWGLMRRPTRWLGPWDSGLFCTLLTGTISGLSAKRMRFEILFPIWNEINV
jgi:hypothetical protein